MVTSKAHARPPRLGRGTAGTFRDLLTSQHGAVALYVGLTMPVLLGGAGLAVDVGSWYQAKRTAQVAVDAAAYAAALDMARQGLSGTPDMTAVRAAANDAAARNGVPGPVTVNNPPLAGLAAGDGRAIEVILAEPAPLFFAGMFLDAAPQVQARAVAKAVVSDACVWSLHPSARGAFTVAGNANVDLACGVVVNSDHEEAALEQTGASCLRATSVTVRGEYSGKCVTPEPEVFAPSYGDPLSALEAPAIGACDHTSKLNLTGGTQFLTPGVYCNDISISGGHVVFQPGLYVLKGDLQVSGNATLTNEENWAGGVTFYLTGSGGKYATVTIASGADVTLTPMTTGPLANVLFFQDPNAPSNGKNKFTGGSTMHLTGILYFPSQHVEFTGGSSMKDSSVLLVASTLTFTGTSHLNANYASSVLPGVHYARLVE